MIHGDHGLDAGGKHSLPLLLTDLLAVVGTGRRLGEPFLLEVCAASDGSGLSGDVVEIVFVHGHADFLASSNVSRGSLQNAIAGAEIGTEKCLRAA